MCVCVCARAHARTIFALVDIVTIVADVSEISVARVACAGVTPDSVIALRVLVAFVGTLLTLINLDTRTAIVAGLGLGSRSGVGF